MMHDEFDLDGIQPTALPDLPAEMDAPDEITKFPYVQFLQPLSTLKSYPKGKGAGLIAVGRNEIVEGVAEWQGILLGEGARFWIIDHLTSIPDANDKYRGKAKRRGAQQAWPYLRDTGKPDQEAKNADGTKAGVLCKSTDGLVPLSSFLKKAVELPANHPEYPATVIIGLSKPISQSTPPSPEDFVISPADAVCANCPLGQWYRKTTSVKGKDEFERLCKSKWNYVIFFPPQAAKRFTAKAKKATATDGIYEEVQWEGGIAILQGHSPSVQSVLEGDVQGSKPHLSIDNKPLPSIFSFMTPTGKKQVVVPKHELHPSYLRLVEAFGPSESNMINVIDEEREAETLAAMADENVKFAAITVNTLPYALNGHPQIVGPSVGLSGFRYLELGVVQSSWNNNPYVPAISTMDVEVDLADYDAFVEALRVYKTENHRDGLMLSDNRITVAERLPKLLTAGDNPLLGDGAIEGEVLDDMA